MYTHGKLPPIGYLLVALYVATHKYMTNLLFFTCVCAAIPFNALDNEEFVQMCEAIGKFGKGYPPPSQYELREKLLSEEYARTKSLLDGREDLKKKYGCTIMTDAWTDMKRRSIMNVCIHCSGGTSFLK